MLRHSFSSQLFILKVFMNLCLICYTKIRPGILVFSSNRTTEGYTQVAINNTKAIKSPLDNLHLK